MTKAKIIKGLIADLRGAGCIQEAELTLRVTHDHKGKGISIADEHGGIMFYIPVEPVEDLIEVKI